MAVTGLDKVFVVNAETNTKYGGVDPTGSFQTVDELRGYKVYTARLTQSGGDDPNTLESGDVLTIGVTYLIGNGSDDPGDFMNVGAPNNDEGTYFVATGETPTKWGKTTLEYNAGAPVATVLENTIGDIWFTYAAVGDYVIFSNSLFAGPYVIFISNNTQDAYEVTEIVKTRIYDVESSNILTYAYEVQANDVLFDTPIEIRVYN